ncbi:MAG: adenylate/guanylate cyclase domain-containing protein [Pseudomonadota bacterium]
MASKTTAPAAVGERKQITAMFIDVVGFSNVASTADAEDLQQWLETFYEQAGTIIAAHDGEVTEYLGDGIVALFGLARADEFSATKAVNAGIAALAGIDASPGDGIKMQLRIGIATGEAAIRDAASAGNLPRVTGTVTTLARRVQEAAAPGELLIAAETQALLRGPIATEALAAQVLKGFDAPQTLYRPLATRQDGAANDNAIFVARDAELQRIAESGDPCLLIGPAGIGKSALTRHLAQQADQTTFIMADALNARTSYQPFIDWLSAQCGTALPVYADVTAQFGDLAVDAQRALALVLGLPEGQQLLTEKSNLALKGLIEGSLWDALKHRQDGGLIVIEDLHWCDAASFGVITHMLQAEDRGGYQFLLTSREDTKIGRHLGRSPLTTIPLDPLPQSDAQTMLAALVGDGPALGNAAMLLEQAGGVPLFLEQLVKRATSGGPDTDNLPGSLADLLSAQIDRTGDTKTVLQSASILGRDFDVDMLGAIATEAGPLLPHLQKAAAMGVLQRDGPARYRFAHALLQRAAYQGMLRKTRQDRHARVAEYLQSHQQASVARNPALLAGHLRLAGQHLAAAQSYLAASQVALFQGAFEDAEAHAQVAITLCDDAGEQDGAADLRIAGYSALGSIRMQTLGFTAAPVSDAFETVAELAARQNAYSAANGPAFYGSFTHGIVSGDKVAADRFSQLLRTAAEFVGKDDAAHELRVASLNVDASLHFYKGDFARQFDTFADLRPLYDVARHAPMIASYGADTFAAAQMFEVAGRSIYGDTHLVRDLLAETDAHQQLLNIPVMAPWAQIWGAVPLFYAGDVDAAVARATLGVETATSQGALFWQVTGGAWLQVMDPNQSSTEDGLAAFTQVISTHELLGANIGLPYFRAHYASALARHGEVEKAYQQSQQAVRENTDSGFYCWFPEVLRLHAAICQQVDRAADAKNALAEAVDVATGQDAKLWLLRARIDQFNAGHIDADPVAVAAAKFDPAANPPEIATARALTEAA